jgi:hypothetical protein
MRLALGTFLREYSPTAHLIPRNLGCRLNMTFSIMHIPSDAVTQGNTIGACRGVEVEEPYEEPNPSNVGTTVPNRPSPKP